jgi:hypothetical protein
MSTGRLVEFSLLWKFDVVEEHEDLDGALGVIVTVALSGGRLTSVRKMFTIWMRISLSLCIKPII